MTTRDDKRYGLRVALVLGETVLREVMVARGGRVTVGQADRATFVLPGEPRRARRGRQVLVDRKGLHLLDGFGGHVHRSGTRHAVADLRAAGHTVVQLAPEDWGVLEIDDGPGVRIVVQRVIPEPAPVLPRQRGDEPLMMSTAISALGFGILLVIAYLRYDPGTPYLDSPLVSDRMARALFNKPPDPPPEEEPTVSDRDQDEEKQRKRAGGEEGKFGDPNRRGPSNIPRNAAETMSERVNVGLVRELNRLDQSETMVDLLGVSGQLNTAFGGQDDGVLVIGEGSFGMSTKGGGGGGGGEGVGSIHGTGDVDVGGAGSGDRKRTVKGSAGPKEKKVAVETGPASIRGQLPKELIDRVVRQHKSQITFCYEKQLLRFPGLSGKVVLKWVIDMDGSVRAAKIGSSSLGNRDAESCMVRALESWKFPKPEGGVVQVDAYPFFFGSK